MLACLLAGGEREASRSRIARLLWGAADPARGLTNLRQTISRIAARQQEIGVALLDFSQTQVRLADESITIDTDLIKSLQLASGGTLFPALGRALTGYRRPFLSELPHGNAELQDWILEQRRVCMEIFSDAVRRARDLAASEADRVLVDEASRRIHDSAALLQPAPLPVRPAPPAKPRESAFPPATEGPRAAVSGALDVLRALYKGQPAPETDLVGRKQEFSLPRLAILPPDGTDQFGLAHSLMEDVTIGLCTCRSLRIVAPYTAQRLARHPDRGQMIIQHNIAYVLDTRMTVSGGEPGLFVQLVFVASDEVVWAERLPLASELLLDHRGAVTARIMDEVTRSVARNETARRYYESNPASYYHYLRGQAHLNHLTLPEIRRARKCFRAALQEMADFGPALAGLARTNHLEWLITARGDPQLLEDAERHARRSIENSADLTAGYRELGVTRLFQGGFDDSIGALSAAEQLSPQYADVIADFGDTLIHASRPAEGLMKIEKAIELNPLTPDGYLWAAAGANYYLENYGEALAYIDRMQDTTPALRLAAACEAMRGNGKRARALGRQLRQHYPDFEIDQWISVLPIKENWQRDHYREGLRKAGL